MKTHAKTVFYKSTSLKTRIFISFFSIFLLLLGSYFFTISRFVVHFTETTLNEDYNHILTATCDSIEDLLWNLTLTSGQILDNKEIQDTIILYQNSQTSRDRKEYLDVLRNSIIALTLANTDISLLHLYDNTEQHSIYSSFPVEQGTPEQYPVLYETSRFSFRGPCVSQSPFNGNPVFILDYTDTLPNGSSVTLSIESGFYSLLNATRFIEYESAYFAVVNAGGELVYTTAPADVSVLDVLNGKGSGDYRTLSETMPQSWSIHIIIPESIYVQDYYYALTDVIISSIILAVFITLIALYFKKSIYSPLQKFDKQLDFLLSEDNDAAQMHSSIPEFDYLLKKIVTLQAQIQNMIQRIIQQEKVNTKIQIEKLRAQINPHFLLNTLNTVHWLALMNEQDEIDKITQALAHLLSYNLDKNSVSTNLEHELSSISEYVELQLIRYHFHFRIERPLPEAELDYPCPKFLLQPLVENAIAHGYRPEMEILIQIKVDDLIHITVSDTGTGMDSKTLARLNVLSQTSAAQNTMQDFDADKVPQFGIGLAYVVTSMRDFFSDNYSFCVSSLLNQGTVIDIEFPKLKGSGGHVKNTDC